MIPNRISDQEVQALLADGNVIHTGHFVGTSGKHLSAYINKDQVGSNPDLLDTLAFELAWRLTTDVGSLQEDDIVAVIGAPMGAVVLANRIAYWFNRCFRRPDGVLVQALYAEKEGEGFLKIRPGFAAVIKGHGVINAEDILTTGKTAKQLTEVVLGCGATTKRVGAIANRGGLTAEQLGVPVLCALMNVQLDSYETDKCPLCAKGVPVRTDLGHGAKFLAEKREREAAKAE